MLEPLLLKNSKKNNNYDFSGVFSNVKKLYNSDYTIANLETPLAGEKFKYVNSLLSFNAPIEFAMDLIESGVDAVTMANNHILDRGIEGLDNTIENLNKANIQFTGIQRNKYEKSPLYFEIDNTKYALISYTYGTNFASNKLKLEDKDKEKVNILRPQEEFYYIVKRRKMGFIERVIRKLLSYLKEEKRFPILKLFGYTYNESHEDDNLKKDTAKPYMDMLRKDIEKAKENSDFVIVYPHIGGQFNKNPGIYSKWVIEEITNMGADFIVAAHTHVVQKFDVINDVPVYYSLGNFNMSPNSSYLIFEDLPQYGIIAHIYMDKGKILKSTFSIIKTIEKKNEQMRVYDTFDLYNKLDGDEKNLLLEDIKTIYKKVTRANLTLSPQEEYIVLDRINDGY